MQLILENIRCFSGRHVVPIKPLTLLIGENSAGKSTFLAALAAVRSFGFPLRPRFNDPPYSLGNFDTIATYKGGRYGRAASFALGFTQDSSASGGTGDQSQLREMVASYLDCQGAVEITELTGREPGFEASLAFGDRSGRRIIEISGIQRDAPFHFEATGPAGFANISPLAVLFWNLAIENRANLQEEVRFRQLVDDVEELFRSPDQDGRVGALSIAPMRTKPRRTYDTFTEEFTPEGEHSPFALSTMLADAKKRASLEAFGRESGLFQQIGIRRLGDKISDPIQVLVTNSGRPANVLDVGYGVSQSLPVVVESLLTESRNILLQQPEVHLHPRAQAALGSFMVDLQVDAGKNFVVETHSDYIVDRIRQEVAKGAIAADKVGILYFEKVGTDTSIYSMSLDSLGNILDAPPTYREFFLREELSLLNR